MHFGIGFIYAKPHRSQFDTYLNAVSDTFHLTKALSAPTSYGISGGVHLRTNKTELECSVSYAGFAAQETNANQDVKVKVKTKDIGVNIGMNYFLNKYILVGGHLVLNGHGGDLGATSEHPQPAIEDTKDQLNFLIGYGVTIRAQAGLNIPFSKGSEKGMRIIPFYDFTLNRFSFYNSYDHHLANYSGDHKTRAKGPGIKLVFVL